MIRWRQALPLLVLLAALAVFLALGGSDLVSVEALRGRRAELVGWALGSPALASVALVLAVTALIAIGFPAVSVPMFAAGVVFGLGWGAALALPATTAGSTIFFLAARHAGAAAVGTGAGALMQRLAQGVERDAFFYLICLRFLPLAPTAVVTLAAAAARLRLAVFFPATLIGLAPASLVYTAIGAGAGAALDAGETVSLQGALLRLEILLPLLGLITLSLAAMALRSRLAR